MRPAVWTSPNTPKRPMPKGYTAISRRAAPPRSVISAHCAPSRSPPRKAETMRTRTRPRHPGGSMYDLKITGGTVVDGTGADRYLADVGIVDGRIVDVRRRLSADPVLEG